MKHKSVKQIAQYGCMLAFAMIVSYVEAMIPFYFGIPGAKLGLANSVIVLCLYLFGAMPALLINITRVILTGILFSNAYSILYSLAGAALSFIIMILLKKIKSFSMIGISIAGGVAHNIGQLLIAFLITEIPILFYYIPVLLVLGTVTGLLNGSLAKLIFNKIDKMINGKSL